MKTAAFAFPCWSTSTFSDNADSLPMELSELGRHMNACQASRGRLFSLQCAADALHSFVASRFVTTLVVVGIVAGVCSLWA